jgi:hypothetical protein
MTAEFDHGGQTPTTPNRVIRTIGSDEVVRDATSIEGGVFTRSTSFRANNPATQSEVDGGARLGSP